MDSYWDKLVTVYGEDGIKTCGICLVDTADLKALKDHQVSSLEQLINVVMAAISNGELK